MKMKKNLFCMPAVCGIAALTISCGAPSAEKTLSGLDPVRFRTELSGRPTDLYRLTNAAGMEVCVTNFGARIVSVMVPDREGTMRDVVLGITPPRTFSNPVYAIIAIVVSIITFIVGRRHRLDLARHKGWAMAMLVTDSLGLGAFTVAGMTTTNPS